MPGGSRCSSFDDEFTSEGVDLIIPSQVGGKDLKSVENVFLYTNVLNTGTLAVFGEPLLGTSSHERVGGTIQQLYGQARFIMYFPSTFTGNIPIGYVCRIIVGVYKQPTDILTMDKILSQKTGSYDVYSPINLETSDVIEILYDEYFDYRLQCLQGTTLPSYGNQDIRCHQIQFAYPKLQTYSVPSDVANNWQYFCVCISANPYIPLNQPVNVDMQLVTYYTDV